MPRFLVENDPVDPMPSTSPGGQLEAAVSINQLLRDYPQNIMNAIFGISLGQRKGYELLKKKEPIISHMPEWF